MSASTMPTLSPERAIETARLTVTEDLPTPPLPEAIAKTLVSEPGWAKGISRAAWPPRSVACSAERCSSFITPKSTWTSVTPGTVRTAAVTSLVRVSRIGQPETVSRMLDGDRAGRGDRRRRLDHPELGDGAADLGVVDAREGSLDLLDGGGAHGL